MLKNSFGSHILTKETRERNKLPCPRAGQSTCCFLYDTGNHLARLQQNRQPPNDRSTGIGLQGYGRTHQLLVGIESSLSITITGQKIANE